ncbi:hypothetical protein [Amycolatopsis thermophila]|uniref:Uncharacterized protein n=1 Tax=Amycolatopsis thermophila TaxID=206084 RepID=A0ABU0EQ34_9PSEU|nr:hypothetical protein [Amycolatopsis thermophila]MDQ0377396.1 hypothetical protein [Amycolatopsis thermophila]
MATIGTLARKYPRSPVVISRLGGAHWIAAIDGDTRAETVRAAVLGRTAARLLGL